MSSSPCLPQIETIVVLMLENRSLDNLLGWLHRGGHPVNIWPPKSQPQHFEGIPSGAVNFKHRTAWRPARGREGLGAQRWRVPRWDPDEGIAGVQVQMYANGDGVLIDDEWGDLMTMGGFAFDFPTSQADSVGEVMGAYTAEELPVLSGLAREFAVSDRWFSSVPSETDPNRAFSLCGTAEGIEYAVQDHVFSSPTLFNALNTSATPNGHKKSWGIFYQSEGKSSMGPIGSICYTQGRFRQVDEALLASKGRGRMASYASLLEDLHSGRDIPEFCYIEPAWGWGKGTKDGLDFVGFQGNDYHPPAWVGPAEWDLNELYVALRRSRQWDKTLFVIVFDEHGGLYDHVPTPRAVPPDNTPGHPFPFRYDRFGPRVPAILVSPFVQPHTVFRAGPGSLAPFDHTSLLKTVLTWADADPAYVAGMGKRLARAPLFDGVLSPTIVQPNAPLDFHPPASFRTQAPKGCHNIPFDCSSLSRDDHHAAAAGSTTMEEYLEALFRRTQPLD